MLQARRPASAIFVVLLGTGCSPKDPTGGTLSKYLSTERCMDRVALVENPDHAKTFMAKEYAQRATCTQEYKKIEAVGCDNLQEGASCRARFQSVDSTQWSHWIELQKREGGLAVDWFSATGFNPGPLRTVYYAQAGGVFAVRGLASFPSGHDDMVELAVIHPEADSRRVDISVEAFKSVSEIVPKDGPPVEVSVILATREDRGPLIMSIRRGWGEGDE